MQRERVRYPLSYRRARSALFAVGLFWLWTWLGSAAFISGLFGSPLHALVAMYALAVAVLVSIPAALLAAARMALNRPYRAGDVIDLPAPQPRPAEAAHWWYDHQAS
jgi:hypothetical protein